MRRRRVLRVELARWSSLISGQGAAELAYEVTGRRPVYVSRLRGYSVSEETARDVIAASEVRGYDIEIVGRRSARARALDALLAAPAPRWPEQPDPGSGRW